MSTDENPIDGLAFSSKIPDISVAGDGAAHRLPVWNDHGRAFDDEACPTELLGSADLNAAGIESDSSGLNLLDGHAAVLGFLAVFVGELDEVDEIRVQERYVTTSRIDDLFATEIEAIPVEEIQQRCDGENGRCAVGPCARTLRFEFNAIRHRVLSITNPSSIIDRNLSIVKYNLTI